MWPIASVPHGSFYFDNQPNMLDQPIANKNMAGDAPIKINAATVQILKLPAMIDPGIYPKPIPFGGWQAGPLIVPVRASRHARTVARRPATKRHCRATTC